MITKPLVTITSDKTILDAARMMVSNNMGLLVILNPGDQAMLAGVISERDIIRALASGMNLNVRVGEVGSRDVVTVRVKADVAEAAKAMNRNRIRHVVVLDEYEKLVGVVSMRDLVGERATLNAILQSHEKEVFLGTD
ncbi:MAG TPA: CBS domain-containing protein [Candidatus Acidoferrum sp.]|nr:CBS domain-containing protein [Candidatus Acidoferrum sp.]